MGMQVGKQGGIKTDINVTPLIDVVLVLLIIFLVTMPIMMRTITIEVPRKLTDQEVVADPNLKTITVTVKSDLTVEIDNTERVINAPGIEVAGHLRTMLEGKEDKLVFVDFEDPVPWEQVVLIMDAIRSVAKDKDHNEVKVAIKMKPEPGEGATP
jgi:biopolymer transport protein TolR